MKLKQGKKAGMNLSEEFKKMDYFGRSLPNFNIKGNERRNSIVGGFISLVLLTLVLMYSTLKFSHLILKKGPTVSSYFRDDEL